jgi:hypothetical protein
MAITTTNPAARKPKPPASKYALFTIEVVVACAVAFFFTWPQYKALQAGNAQLAGDKSSLASSQAQAAAYQKSVKGMQASSTAAISEAIPPKDSITDLYAYIESFVNASNLTMTSVQVTDGSTNSASSGASSATGGTAGATDATGTDVSVAGTSSTSAPAANPVPAGIGVANIHLVVTGTNAQFNQLLASFQNSLRLIDVQDVSFSIGSSGGESFTVDALAYYQQ